MARAQTYIIDSKDRVYSYSSDFHDENYRDYLENNHINLQVAEIVPFLLMRQETCVIDIVRHTNLGCMYLPNNLTEFQRNWIIDRENYFQKLLWQLSKMEEDKKKNYDNVNFSKIKAKILK